MGFDNVSCKFIRKNTYICPCYLRRGIIMFYVNLTVMAEIFSDIDIIEGLIKMGLSEREAKVYKVLLGVKEITASGIPKFTDVPRTKVYEALNSLARIGFCKERSSESAGGRLYSAVDPKIALGGLMAEAKEHFSQINSTYESLSTMMQSIYENSSDRLGEYDFVEVLKGRGEILDRYSTLRNSAKLEILELSKGPYVMSQEERDLEAQENERIIKSGVKMNVIYEAREIEDFGDNFFYRQCANAGVSSRIIPSLPMKMTLFDKRVVMLPLRDALVSEPNLTVVVIEHAKLYEMLETVFWLYWENAKEI